MRLPKQMYLYGSLFLLSSASILFSCSKGNKSSTPAQPNYADSVKRSLWAYYNFDSSMNDLSGNNHNITAMGGLTRGYDMWGRANAALDFNGTTDYALIDSGTVFPAGDFTFSALCMFRSIAGSRIFTKAEYATGNGASLGLGFVNATGDAIGTFVTTDPNICSEASDPSKILLLDLTTPPQLNAWYFVTLVYKQGTVSIYVNGTLQGSQTSTTATTWTTCSNAPFYLGTWWAQDPSFYNGKMDELRIYTRALSQAEISYLTAEVNTPL